MSSEASPAVKSACPFCTGRLNDSPAPLSGKYKSSWYLPTNRFVSCHICKALFKMVPNWFRLVVSTVLLGISLTFALLLVGIGHVILWWLDGGHQLSPFLIAVLGLITAMLIYGGVRASEQLFHYLFNSMMVLVDHPDLENRT